MSPVRTHTMKEYEQQIAEMKKENFSLKLRIYFMEERMQQKFEDNDDIKTNIELKIEVESLKKELQEQQQLLVKASTAVESLAHEKEENQEARDQLRNQLEAKCRRIQLEMEELQKAKDGLQEQLKNSTAAQDNLEGTLHNKNMAGLQQQDNRKEALAEKDRVIEQLNGALRAKDQIIGKLNDDKVATARKTIQPLQDEVNKLKGRLQDKDNQIDDLQRDAAKAKDKDSEKDRIRKQYEDIYHEQEKRVHELEEATEQLQDEVREKTKAMKDMENALKVSQKVIKELDGKIKDKEGDVGSLESGARKRDKAIQGLTETVRAKDKEIGQLCDQIEDLEDALTKANDALHKAEKKKYEGMEQTQSSLSELEEKLADMRANVQAKDLENERLQRSMARKQHEVDRLKGELQDAEDQIDGAGKQREDDIKQLKDQLHDAKAKAKENADSTEQHYQNLLDDGQHELEMKEKSIQRLTKGLQEKDRLVKAQQASTEGLLQDLRDKLADKDKALQEANEDRIKAVEAKEGELRSLKQALRDHQKDLDRARGDLMEDANRLGELEAKMKDLENKNKQLADNIRALNKTNQDGEDNHKRSLREKDAIIGQMQTAMAGKERELQEEREKQRKNQVQDGAAKDTVMKQLSDRLKAKDKQLEDIVAERAEVAAANERATQDLLQTIRDKDGQIKDLNDKYNRALVDKANAVRDLQRQVNEKEFEVQSAEDMLNRADQEQGMLLGKMRNALAEKDKTIEKLLESGREKDRLFLEMQQSAVRASPSPGQAADMARLKDENDRLAREVDRSNALLKETRSRQPSPDYVDSLKDELDSKNRLLAKAKESLESLQEEHEADRQAKQSAAKLRRKIMDLEDELQAKQERIDALSNAAKVKDNFIRELKIENTKIIESDSSPRSTDSSDQLQQLLQQQIHELSRLTAALNTNLPLNVNITHQSETARSTRSNSVSRDDRGSHDGGGGEARTRRDDNLRDMLGAELAAMQSLRRQMEEGIGQRGHHDTNLHVVIDRQGVVQSATTSGVGSGVGSDSNDVSPTITTASEAQRRSFGVGHDPDAIAPPLFSHDTGLYIPVPQRALSLDELSYSTPATKDELRQEVVDLRSQLQESKRRQESLEKQLEREDLESLRSIPGQDLDDPAPATNKDLRQEVSNLRSQLRESKRRQESLEKQESLRNIPGQDLDNPTAATNRELRQEVSDLRSQLRESKRRQESLEKQLEREDLESLRSIPGHDLNDPSTATNEELQEQVDDLCRQLKDAKRRYQLLEKRLEHEDLESLRSIPGQEHDTDPQVISGLHKDLAEMRKKLKESKNETTNLKQQLDAALLNQLSSDSSGDHVVPILKQQLDQAKTLLEEKVHKLHAAEHQNSALRHHLGIGPESPPDSGKGAVDNLKLENERLASKLQEVVDREHERLLRMPLDTTQTQTSQTQTLPRAGSDSAQVALLQKKLDKAKNLIELLKRHIRLNGAGAGAGPEGHDSSEFNPELIVDMAREIERLRGEIESGQVKGKPEGKPEGKPIGRDDVDSGMARPVIASSVSSAPPERTVPSSLLKELEKAQMEMNATKRRFKALTMKLHATEGTVHQQAERIKRYRRQLHNVGVPAPGTPKRVSSDSNLMNMSVFAQANRRLSAVSLSQIPSSDDDRESTASSASLTQSERSASIAEVTFAGFGLTDDTEELKEQVVVLRKQLKRCRHVIRKLQTRLKGAGFSRPTSPSRDPADRNAWFELVANREAFERLQQDLENVTSQLEKVMDANSSLQDRNAELLSELVELQTQRQNSFSEEVIRSQELEIGRLHEQLAELRSLMSVLTNMLSEALGILKGLEKDNKTAIEGGYSERVTVIEERLNDGNEVVDTIRKLLGDESQFGRRRSEEETKELFSDRLKVKDEQMQQLRDEIRGQQKLNRELQDILHNNQLKADAMKDELKRVKSNQMREAMKTQEESEKQKKRNDVMKDTLRLQEEKAEAARRELERDYKKEIIILQDRLKETKKETSKSRDKNKTSHSTTDINEGQGNIYLYETNIKLSSENNSLQQRLTEQDDRTQRLKAELDRSNKEIKRLHSEKKRVVEEKDRLKEQMRENEQLANSLRFELSVYEQLHTKDTSRSPGSPRRGRESNGGGYSSPHQASPSTSRLQVVDRTTGVDLTELLQELRHLRIQLERSIDTNNSLRLLLEETIRERSLSPSRSSRERSTSPLSPRNSSSSPHSKDARSSSSLLRTTTAVRTEETRDRRRSPGSKDRSSSSKHYRDALSPLRDASPSSSSLLRPKPASPSASPPSPRATGRSREEIHITHRSTSNSSSSHYDHHMRSSSSRKLFQDGKDQKHKVNGFMENELAENGVAPLAHQQNSRGRHTSSHHSDPAEGDASKETYAVSMLTTYEAVTSGVKEAAIVGGAIDVLLRDKLSHLDQVVEESSPHAKGSFETDGTDLATISALSLDVQRLLKLLDSSRRHLVNFWTTDRLVQQHSQSDEVKELRKRLGAQERLMREARDRLAATNREKESMEDAIIRQLCKTHAVIRKAKGNLQAAEA